MGLPRIPSYKDSKFFIPTPLLQNFGLTPTDYEEITKYLKEKRSDKLLLRIFFFLLSAYASYAFFSVTRVSNSIGETLKLFIGRCIAFLLTGEFIVITLIAAVLAGLSSELYFKLLEKNYRIKALLEQEAQYSLALKNSKEALVRYEDWKNKTNKDYWTTLDGHDFEIQFTNLLNLFGYDARKTRGSGDGGVDIEIFEDGKLDSIVSCKAHKKPIGPGPGRDLVGTLTASNANTAILVSTSGFSSGARQFAKDRVVLWDLEKILRMQSQLEEKLIKKAS